MIKSASGSEMNIKTKVAKNFIIEISVYAKSLGLPTGVGYVSYTTRIIMTWRLHVPVAFLTNICTGSLLSLVVV